MTCPAPIVSTAKTSIVSIDTLHQKGYTVVSNSSGMPLQKDGIACEAVPDGVVYRIPVVDTGKVDDKTHLAVALHKKKVLAA